MLAPSERLRMAQRPMPRRTTDTRRPACGYSPIRLATGVHVQVVVKQKFDVVFVRYKS